MALDKTGTITTGQMRCTSIETAVDEPAAALVGVGAAEVGASGGAVGGVGSGGKSDVGGGVVTGSPNASPMALSIAASLERGATHPIARAVIDTADAEEGLPEVIVSDFKAVAGHGVEGMVRLAPGFGFGAEGAGVVAAAPRLVGTNQIPR